MRATKVLQECLGDALQSMHALRRRVLLRAVEAVIHGRRLTLIDVARAWPDAERIRAPLKALDRLLGNPHLHAEREHLHAAMARWLLRGPHPVIVLDWCNLKADQRWHLLRAAVPVGGRTLTILDMVFPDGQQGSPAAEKQFLQRLATLIPEDVQPILVTDAGFTRAMVPCRRSDGLVLAGTFAASHPGQGRRCSGYARCVVLTPPPLTAP